MPTISLYSLPFPLGPTNVHPLRDSYILDGGATRHVTNDSSRILEPVRNELLPSVAVGLQIIPVETEGVLSIRPDRPAPGKPSV